VYREAAGHTFEDDELSRRLQSVWMSLRTDDLSAALGCHVNMYCPSAKISRLLLLSGANPNFITSNLQNAPLLQVMIEFLDPILGLGFTTPAL
jgi:hypothetical protein